MSIPNRTVTITGIFAADASTTIPDTPVSGASYRNTAMTGTIIREGWAYKTIVDSANFNQALFEYSTVTKQIETYGFLPWSSLTDYVEGSLCLGSNGVIYQAKQNTGPSSTAKDPTTDSDNTYWEDFVGSTYVRKTGSNTISATNTFSGQNTFTENIIISRNDPRLFLKDTNCTKGTAPTNSSYNYVFFNDSGDNRLAFLEQLYNTSKMTRIGLGVYKANSLSDSENASLSISYPASGDPYTAAPTPSSATDNTTKIATTAWMHNFLAATNTKGIIVNYCIPKYSAGVSLSNPYTAPSSGYITLGHEGTTSSTPPDMQVKINNATKFRIGGRGDNGAPRQMISFPVDKGDSISWTLTNGTLAYANFYPMKGVA